MDTELNSSTLSDVQVQCLPVAFVQPLEDHAGEYVALEITLGSGAVLRLAFAAAKADELIEAITRSQAVCRMRRAAPRH